MWLAAIRKSPAAPGAAATRTPTQLSWTELATIRPCSASLMRMPKRLFLGFVGEQRRVGGR
jgi:hypothetical protein